MRFLRFMWPWWGVPVQVLVCPVWGVARHNTFTLAAKSNTESGVTRGNTFDGIERPCEGVNT